MIGLDSSSVIAFLEGASGADVDAVDESLDRGDGVLSPVALTELLSDPKLAPRVAAWLRALPRLEILDGYWGRSAALRAKVLASGRKAPLADTLIAQSCLDHRVALITRDTDFRHFARVGGLKLVTG